MTDHPARAPAPIAAAPPAARDVSVVIQGPVAAYDPVLNRSLAALRRHLPGAEIVLSTYATEDRAVRNYLMLLDVDALILSEDPGAISHNPLGPVFSNVNRMIRTSAAGIARATRPYVLRLRSDAVVTGTRFLEMAGRFPRHDLASRLFAERIVVSSVFTRRAYNERQPAAFHVSDWFQFGRREDVAYLFDIPYAEEPAYSTHFVRRWRHIDPAARPYAFGSMNLRYPPESYVVLACARKRFAIPHEDWHDDTADARDWSNRIIMSNFLPLDPPTAGIILDKPAYRRQVSLAHLDYRMTELAYTFAAFQEEYRRLFEPALAPELTPFDRKARRYRWLRRWEMAVDRGETGRLATWLFRRTKVVLRHLTRTRF